MNPHGKYKDVNKAIRRVWYRLSDDELKAREERRDIFFLAVRKKHGLPRAEAQLFLNDLEREFDRVIGAKPF